MAIANTNERVAPKSILRHRPIGDNAVTTKKIFAATNTKLPAVARASRPETTTTETPRVAHAEINTTDYVEPTTSGKLESRQTRKGPTGTLSAVKQEQRSVPQPKPEARAIPSAGQEQKGFSLPLPEGLEARVRLSKKNETSRHVHPLMYLGAGMVIAILLWFVVSMVVGWGTDIYNNIHYGTPRTYQTDAWVGHNEQTGFPSHFVAMNLHGRIEVIEVPGGDPTHERVYLGPQLYGANNDLVPVILSFTDINGDHKPDMIVSFQGTKMVYINANGGFRPVQPSEQPEVTKALQHLP